MTAMPFTIGLIQMRCETDPQANLETRGSAYPSGSA